VGIIYGNFSISYNSLRALVLNSTLGHLYLLQSEHKLLQITVHTATDGLKILTN
jgi:hypothetical protein